MATINYISSLHAAKTYYTCDASASDNRMTRQARTNGTTYVHHLLLHKEDQLTLLSYYYYIRFQDNSSQPNRCICSLQLLTAARESREPCLSSYLLAGVHLPIRLCELAKQLPFPTGIAAGPDWHRRPVPVRLISFVNQVTPKPNTRELDGTGQNQAA